MTQITLTEAQLHLSELIATLQPGEEVQICQDDRPVSRSNSERPENLASQEVRSGHLRS